MTNTERALVFVGVGSFLFVYVVLGSRLVNLYRSLRPSGAARPRWALGPLLTFALVEVLRPGMGPHPRRTDDPAVREEITKTIRTARAVLTVSALAFLVYIILARGRP